MSALIVVSPSHCLPVPLVCNLGHHTLVITSGYDNPDAFELVAPVIREGATFPNEDQTIIFDHDEAYNLYQCLHTLFFGPQQSESVV